MKYIEKCFIIKFINKIAIKFKFLVLRALNIPIKLKKEKNIIKLKIDYKIDKI